MAKNINDLKAEGKPRECSQGRGRETSGSLRPDSQHERAEQCSIAPVGHAAMLSRHARLPVRTPIWCTRNESLSQFLEPHVANVSASARDIRDGLPSAVCSLS